MSKGGAMDEMNTYSKVVKVKGEESVWYIDRYTYNEIYYHLLNYYGFAHIHI